MFFTVHSVLVFIFCSVVAIKLLSTVIWPGPKKFVKRDYFVNNLITNVREVINLIGEDAISVSDIVISIPSDIPGQFWATSGWLRNMTSFHRVEEDIDVSLGDMNENVEFDCYLKYVVVTFNHFRANVSNEDYYGSIQVNVKKNLFRIELTLDFLKTGNCTATLNRLVLDEFTDIKVNVTGTENNMELTMDIQNWVTNNVLILVKHRLENYFHQVFSYVLAKQDFCIAKAELDDDTFENDSTNS